MAESPTVSNSSWLITLEGIGRLALLNQLYGDVTVPRAVAAEVGSAIPAWMQIRDVQNIHMAQSLGLQLGSGEAEAISLALELSAERLIPDDKKARSAARRLGLPIMGTVAVVIRAKQQSLVSSVRLILVAVHF